MSPDDSDFILNIANQSARDILSKLKKAHEYFREDPERNQKCFILHHLTCVHLMADYILTLSQCSNMTIREVIVTLSEDAISLSKSLKKEYDKND